MRIDDLLYSLFVSREKLMGDVMVDGYLRVNDCHKMLDLKFSV